MNKQGTPKGDGLVCFANEASVNLCITLHDGADFRPGFKLTCQKADFQQKGEYRATSLSTEQTEALRKQQLEQKKKLGWGEGKQTIDQRRIVILKHMFLPEEAMQYPNFYNGVRMEVGTEVERVCGMVEKLTVFEGSPEGVIAIKFEEPHSAELCIQQFNGRWYGFRQLEATYFDGTDYRVKETEEEKAERIKKFGEWLEQQQQANEAAQVEMMADAVVEQVESIPEKEPEKTDSALPDPKRVKTSE